MADAQPFDQLDLRLPSGHNRGIRSRQANRRQQRKQSEFVLLLLVLCFLCYLLLKTFVLSFGPVAP